MSLLFHLKQLAIRLSMSTLSLVITYQSGWLELSLLLWSFVVWYRFGWADFRIDR